jgi:HK97 family phage prohead protease
MCGGLHHSKKEITVPNKIEFKNVPFEIKNLDEKTGYIEGYASTFGNMDLGFDIMEAGAFAKTIRENAKVPILKNHSWSMQLGWNHEASEDDKGLFVKGKYNMEDPATKGAFHLAMQGIEIGAKVGLSIGYMTIKEEPDAENPRIRRLKEVKLMEYSQVTFPMNTEAMITAAKSFAGSMDVNAAFDALLEECVERGYTKNQVIEILMKRMNPEINPPMDGQLLEGLKNLNKIITTK